MKLNHLDLPVRDIARTKFFLVRFFDFREVFAREDGLSVLVDEDGFALTLSPLTEDQPDEYPNGFHIGFNVASEGDLLRIHGDLLSGGVAMVRQLGDLNGAMTFHCHAPGQILVEVAYRPQRVTVKRP